VSDLTELPGGARNDWTRPARHDAPRAGAPAGILLWVALLVPLLAPAGRAQDEFLLNDDRVLRGQGIPRAALGSTGAIAAVWTDGRNGPESFIDYDIYLTTVRDPRAPGARLNRRVNDDIQGALQTAPSIAGSPSGTFFCAWEDSRTGNPDIFGVAMDSLGLALGPNFRLNDDPGTADQRRPAVAAVGADRYLVLWGDQRGGQSDIFGEWRTGTGAPIDGNVTISSDPVPGGSYQGEPALAANAAGRTLVVWLDGREGGSTFGVTFDVYGQWLDSAGIPIGGNFKINDTVGPQKNASPTVAADSSQGFVVGWLDRRVSASDPGDVYAQRFGPDGTRIGDNVRVNDDPLGREQRLPRVLGGPGAALVVWEDVRELVTLDVNVEAARVPYDGSPPGANFRVNSSTPARQGAPGGAFDGRDSYLIVWEDARNGPTDIYSISIQSDGTRNSEDTELNDDAAPHAQWRPRAGGNAGLYFATWMDDRNGRHDLYGQWVYATGLRVGPNILLSPEEIDERATGSDASVNDAGAALAVAQITRTSDAGEIRGFLLPDPSAGLESFWISDSLISAQSMPAVAPQGDGFGVVWIDTRDGSPRIYGQRLDAQGTRIGGNHPVLAADPAASVYALDLVQDGAGGFWLAYAEGAIADQRLWLAHLGGSLTGDAAPAPVAPELNGGRAAPRLGCDVGGRVELVWVGTGPSGVGRIYHQAFTGGGLALAAAATPGDPQDELPQDAPDVAVFGSRSVVTWEGKRNANWEIWLRIFQDGTIPVSGVVRVDEDTGLGDKFDPGVGLDAAGHVFVLWADGRSASSGFDILARVFDSFPTSVLPDPPPTPDPGPAPPRDMSAGPARPNPFGSIMHLPVEAPPRAARLRAYVVNARGERVRTLLDGRPPAQRFTLGWDGTDGRGTRVSSGVYWIVIEGGGERRALRVVTLR
jgi:FlgD Ig-like domain